MNYIEPIVLVVLQVFSARLSIWFIIVGSLSLVSAINLSHNIWHYHTIDYIYFQLPSNTGLQTVESMQILEQNKQCLVKVSQYKFTEVISGLVDVWRNVEQTVGHKDAFYHL